MSLKANIKISSFIVALLLISLFFGVFAIFLSDATENYCPNCAETINISEYNKLSELDSLTEEVRTSALNATEKQGITDILGSFFSSAYDALKLSFNSINIFYDISETAVSQSEFADSATTDYIRISLISIVVILVLFVIISALAKWDL